VSETITMHPPALAAWHRLVQSQDAAGLNSLVADDAVFHSPVVHTPQRGKPLVVAYLSAAFQVFFTDNFRYVREVVGANDAVLEFELEVDGTRINGVDMIRWNGAGQITDFKVMLRPLKAVNLIHQKMGEMLQRQAAQQQQ
jgi:ketosteroid isomerase-like protein